MATKAVQEDPVVQEEEYVDILLPIQRGVEKQMALYVGVNDRSWVIPRGKKTRVPKCVAEVIQHSEEEAVRAEEYRQSIGMA